MTVCHVDNIHVYPIKSAAGIELSKAWLDDFGLAFDRRFVLSSIMGQFITARTEPSLSLIDVLLIADGLMINAPNMPSLTIKYQALSDHYQKVEVWSNTISAQHCSREIDKWFSQYLQKPCQLLFFGNKSERYVENSSRQVGFADGYPLLLLSQASLTALNNLANKKLNMARFRPNIVVDHCDAFAEDSWQHIRIGEVEFEVVKPCARCVFTTIDPKTAEMDLHQEPLTSLKRFRQTADGEVMFGQNLIPLSQGLIKQGDRVEIIQTKSAPIFILPSSNNENVASSPSEKNESFLPSNNTVSEEIGATAVDSQSKSQNCQIVFKSWNKSITANKKQSILEQGENAGLILPYSCRAGMCGRCKLKLESGTVKQFATDGLSEADQQKGLILACRCLPLSDIVLSNA